MELQRTFAKTGDSIEMTGRRACGLQTPWRLRAYDCKNKPHPLPSLVMSMKSASVNVPPRALSLVVVALLAGAVAAEPAPPSAPVQSAQARPAHAPAAQPAPQQRAATLKQWMQASQAQLRSCEWVENTAVSVNVEQKSQVQKRCYYGADGALQKLPFGEEPAADAPRGALRKRIAENRKEELNDYMKSARTHLTRWLSKRAIPHH